MTKRYRKDEKLEEVAKEHVSHLSGETAAGRTDPAAAGHRVRQAETPEGKGAKRSRRSEGAEESEEPGAPGGGV